MTAHDALRMIVESNRRGKQIGISSWCAAHPLTLRAIFDAHRDDDQPLLIEARATRSINSAALSG